MNQKRALKIGYLSLLTLFASSCASFQSVRDYASLSGAVKKASTSMANELYDSCMRSAQYTSLASQTPQPPKELPQDATDEEKKKYEEDRASYQETIDAIAELQRIELKKTYLDRELSPEQKKELKILLPDAKFYFDQLDKKTPEDQINISGLSAISQREFDEAICKLFKRPLVSQSITAHSVLITYMDNLGKLASNDTVPFDETINEIENSLKEFDFRKDDGSVTKPLEKYAEAGITIASVIIEAFINDFKRKNLKEAILCTDDAIQTYSNGLIEAMQITYLDGTLLIEQKRANKYFNDYAVLRLAQSDGSVNVSQFLALDQDFHNTRNAINKKESAALAYMQILRSTANLHSGLKKEFRGKGDEMMSEDDIDNFCMTKNLDNNNNFPLSHDYDKEQLQRINRMLITYQEKVRFELSKIDKAF